jgi:hypothetical protein
VVTPSPDDGGGGDPQPPPGGPGGTEATPTTGSGPGGPAASPPPDEEPEPPPSEGETEWEGNVDFTCEVAGGGKQILWRAYIDLEFAVSADGSIAGSGAGEFTESSISMPECACEFSQLGSISAQVSGSREGEFFHLSVMPSAEMVERCVCHGETIEVPVMQLLACVSVPGGPTDFTIEARDNAWVEWRGTQEGIGGSIIGTGVSAVYPK